MVFIYLFIYRSYYSRHKTPVGIISAQLLRTEIYICIIVTI